MHCLDKSIFSDAQNKSQMPHDLEHFDMILCKFSYN